MSSIKSYFPVFKFVAVFSGVYILLSLLYYFYLQPNYTGINYPDPATSQVSYQVQQTLCVLGYDAEISNAQQHPSVYMHVNQYTVYRVIEGCNAVSVMILFVAFVLAFAKAWKKTLLFILLGIVFIHIVNVLRLVALAIIELKMPQYNDVAHDIAFPAVIYGSVILLWIYWIRKPKKA